MFDFLKQKMIDLQLFSEEVEETEEIIENEMEEEIDIEDTEDQERNGDPEDLAEDLDEDSQSEEEEDPDEEEEEEGEVQAVDPKKDKVTAALIKEKKARKKLEKALREAEEKTRKLENKKMQEREIEDLIDKGYGEEHAKHIVNQKSEINDLKREIEVMRVERLEGKYPGISNYANEIIDLKAKTNLSIEEIYNAKFRSLSEFDIKTKAEQETLYRKKQAKKKKGVDGVSKSTKDDIKLSPEDERAFKLLKKSKQFKSLTKKEYKELSNTNEI